MAKSGTQCADEQKERNTGYAIDYINGKITGQEQTRLVNLSRGRYNDCINGKEGAIPTLEGTYSNNLFGTTPIDNGRHTDTIINSISSPPIEKRMIGEPFTPTFGEIIVFRGENGLIYFKIFDESIHKLSFVEGDIFKISVSEIANRPTTQRTIRELRMTNATGISKITNVIPDKKIDVVSSNSEDIFLKIYDKPKPQQGGGTGGGVGANGAIGATGSTGTTGTTGSTGATGATGAGGTDSILAYHYQFPQTIPTFETRFITFNEGGVFSATDTNMRLIMASSGTLHHLAVRTTTSQPLEGGSLIVTVRIYTAVSGYTLFVDTPLVVIIPPNSVAGVYNSGVLSTPFSLYDLVTLKIFNGAFSNSAEIETISVGVSS